jgi:hypothetical protein
VRDLAETGVLAGEQGGYSAAGTSPGTGGPFGAVLVTGWG